ncbi:SIMPL domain-containing protein [Halovivax sp.]|uniref:SIMPL domain-containing protein n=1 Tax=Halovivax sp. TaxID=1935978 RepID=UPI0025BF4DBE|nr:SIMPL domain-containing protein [Halovivax sp.]
MDRRRFLAASGVGVAIASAGCIEGVLGAGNGDDDSLGAPPEDDPGNEIEVRADGVVEVEPDEATLTVGVEASGESADEVSDELAADAETLRETFDELGIPEDDVESGRYDVRQPRNSTRYEGSHSFRLRLDDPDRVGEVIDAVAAAGADDVGRVRFGLTDETREELRERALDEAFANADAEAEHVAANRGVELTGTRSVSTTDVDVSPVRVSHDDVVAEADDADGAPPTEIDEGLATVSASVTVTYSFAD